MRSGATPSSRALFADLEEFVHDHRPHGPLTVDATEPAWSPTISMVTAAVLNAIFAATASRWAACH